MKKVMTILFALLISANSFGQAPNWAWAKSAGSAQEDEKANAIVHDSNGNSYMIGSFGQTITFGTYVLVNDTTTSNKDIFFVKYDNLGNVVWEKSFGGNKDDVATCLTIDNNDNIYLAGYYRSRTIAFDNVIDTNVLQTGSSTLYCNQIFVAKFDSSGSTIWAKFSSGQSNSTVRNIAVDKNNHLIIVGNFYYSLTIDSTFLWGNYGNGLNLFYGNLDSNGMIIWAKSANYSRTIDSFSGILYQGEVGLTIDNSNNILFTCGFQYMQIDSFPLNATPGFDNDILIAKLNNAGDLLWQKKEGGYYDDYGTSITTDINNNIYITGNYSSGYISFDTISFNDGTQHNDYSFIVKHDSLGNALWAIRPYTSSNFDFATQIKTDNYGNVILCEKRDIGGISSNIFAAIISKYGASGNLIWNKTVNASPKSLYVSKFDIDEQSNIFLCGQFYGVGGTNINVIPSLYNSSASLNVLIAKLGSGCTLGFSSQTTSQVVNINANATFSVIASQSGATYQWQLNSGSGFTNLTNTMQYSGVNTNNLTVSNAAISQNNYYFRCVVTKNGCGATSTAAMLTVNCILNQNYVNNVYANTNSNAQFTVSAINPSVTYQWQESSSGVFVNLVDTGQYQGSNNDTLTINNVTNTQNGNQYRCIINNGSCTDTSNVATLNVGVFTMINNIQSPIDFSISPNPTSSTITLTIPKLINTNISITNLTGKQVATYNLQNSTAKTIDVSHLAEGVYFVTLKSDEGVVTKKMVKVN